MTALLYVAVAVFEFIVDSDEPLGSRIGFPIVLLILAVALLGGVRLIRTQPILGATLASVSALVGAFALFWTLLAIPLGIAIVIFSVIAVRNRAPGTTSVA